MPTTRLFPSSTTATDMTVVGAATAHQALSDESDSSYLTDQLSQFETVKVAHGTGTTQLPAGAGVIVGTVFNVRGYRDSPGSINVIAGEDGGPARVSGTPGTSATSYASSSLTVWTTAAQINALGWNATLTWNSQDGVSGFITDVSMDVTYDFVITGFKGFILNLLGPLVAVGLHEMPRLADAVYTRSKTLITPAEYAQAWRELRMPHRIYA